MTAATKIERSGPAIRAVLAELSPAECEEFETEFRQALAHADADFDLGRVDAVLDRWWGIAAMCATGVRTVTDIGVDEQLQQRVASELIDILGNVIGVLPRPLGTLDAAHTELSVDVPASAPSMTLTSIAKAGLGEGALARPVRRDRGDREEGDRCYSRAAPRRRKVGGRVHRRGSDQGTGRHRTAAGSAAHPVWRSSGRAPADRVGDGRRRRSAAPPRSTSERWSRRRASSTT